MEPKERCDSCAHWENRPELEMPANVGYCDYHEKMFKADYSCKFFLNKTSAEALEYRRGIYGGTDEDEEDSEMDV